MERRQIYSLKELQREVVTILERVNQDQALARAAAANPILALEDLGYHIAPDVQPSIEHRMRFSLSTSRRLGRLRKQIFKIAGRQFEINSPQELHTVLFEELRLPIPETRPLQQKEQRTVKPSPITAPLLPQVGWGTAMEDPLNVLAGAHPIVEPLLEYRRLEAGQPRFASREVYEAIKAGRRAVFATRLRARLRQRPIEDNEGGEGDDQEAPAEKH